MIYYRQDRGMLWVGLIMLGMAVLAAAVSGIWNDALLSIGEAAKEILK